MRFLVKKREENVSIVPHQPKNQQISSESILK